VIPVTRGVTDTTSELFRKYLSNKLWKQEIKELHKQPYWAPHANISERTDVKVRNMEHGK